MWYIIGVTHNDFQVHGTEHSEMVPLGAIRDTDPDAKGVGWKGLDPIWEIGQCINFKMRENVVVCEAGDGGNSIVSVKRGT